MTITFHFKYAMKTYVFYGFNIAIHILEQFKMRKTFTLPSYIPFLNLFISLSRSKFMVYVICMVYVMTVFILGWKRQGTQNGMICIYDICSCREKNFLFTLLAFPGGSVEKESAYNAGDWGSKPGSGRSPGEENGNPLQYSCLENSMDRGSWWATVRGIPKSWTGLRD